MSCCHVFMPSGVQQLRQYELALEEAAMELHSTEEQLQASTRQLLALQTRCAEASAELQSHESAAEKV